jgi:hypothetical protein
MEVDSESNRVGDDGCQYLSLLVGLVDLNVGSCLDNVACNCICDEGVAALVRLPRLKRL